MNDEKTVVSVENGETTEASSHELIMTEELTAVDEKGKGARFFKNALAKTGDVSKKVFVMAVDKTQELAEQSQARSFEARKKKYKPLFPDEYSSSEFHFRI